MLGAIRRLFGGGSEAPPAAAADAIEYKGYRIIPQPQKAPGGFLTSGLIVLENDAGRREHRFVRADTHSSADDARHFIVLKAQRLIDEQGERLFGG